MSQSFPCPNPVCTHVFPATAVQGSASLTCPRCGGVFQFRQPSAAPSKPAPPRPVKPATIKAPVVKASPPPAAKERTTPPPPPKRPALPPPTPPFPVAPAVPMAMPVTTELQLGPPPVPEMSSDLAFDEPTAMVSTGSRRRRPAPTGKRTFLLLGLLAGGAVLILGGVATALAILVLPKLNLQGDGPPQPKFDGTAFNFEYTLPGEPWKDDHNVQLTMRTQLAMKRTNPNSGMALNARDYKKRIPDDAELLAEALEKLNLEFKNVEWERKPPDSDRLLGGQPCLCIEFRGITTDEVYMNGYCYALAYRGFGYWLFTWSADGDKDAADKESDRVRQGFKLGPQREGWREQPRETFPVQGTKIHYRLDAVKELWQQKPNREGGDPKADRVMTANYPSEKPHTGKMATFQAVVLDKADSPEAAEKAVRDYLLEAEKKKTEDTYLYPNTKIDIMDDKSIINREDIVGSGPLESKMLKLRVEREQDHVRYVVVRILNHADGVLMLWCECDYKYYSFWDSQFGTLLDSLTMR